MFLIVICLFFCWAIYKTDVKITVKICAAEPENNLTSHYGSISNNTGLTFPMMELATSAHITLHWSLCVVSLSILQPKLRSPRSHDQGLTKLLQSHRSISHPLQSNSSSGWRSHVCRTQAAVNKEQPWMAPNSPPSLICLFSRFH